MKKIVILISFFFVINISLSAQKNEPVIVKAGMRVIDCFPFIERYRYPEFIQGRVYFKNGIYSDSRLNYNLLMGEMEYIKSRDTLSIFNKKDIRFITMAQDTFFYDNGVYLELISEGQIKVALKDYFKLKEVLKKDSYGTSSSGSATTSFGTMPVDGNFLKLQANEDMVFQRTREFYMSESTGGFVPFNKKNVLKLYPQKNNMIKDYLKSNNIDFDSRDHLLRLADFLGTL